MYYLLGGFRKKSYLNVRYKITDRRIDKLINIDPYPIMSVTVAMSNIIKAIVTKRTTNQHKAIPTAMPNIFTSREVS